MFMVAVQSQAALRGVYMHGTYVMDELCNDKCRCEPIGSDPPAQSLPRRPGREWSDSGSDSGIDTDSKGLRLDDFEAMAQLSLELSGSDAVGPSGSRG